MLTEDCAEPRFPRCPDCGGRVELRSATGKTREFLRGVHLPIPGDIELPTCVKCGELSMNAEYSDLVDSRLARIVSDSQKFVDNYLKEAENID